MGEDSRPQLEAMRIVTGCTTATQFVDVFHRFCDGTTLFIPTTELRPIGSRLAFSLRLADGTPMLRGSCVVRDAWASFANTYKRPGVLLELEKLSSESDAIVEQMRAQKTAVTAAPAAPLEDDQTTRTQRTAPMVSIGRGPAKPTHQLRKPSRAKAAASRPPETRTPGSPLVLPANPLTGMDDAALCAFLECTVTAVSDATDEDGSATPRAAARDIDSTQPTLAPPSLAPPTLELPTLEPSARDTRTLQGMTALTPPRGTRAAPPPIPAAARTSARKRAAGKPTVG